MGIRRIAVAGGLFLAALSVAGVSVGESQAATIGKAGALAAGTVTPFAATINWDNTRFSHDYRFSVSAPYTLEATVKNLSPNAFEDKTLYMKLYEDGSNTDTLIGSVRTNGGSLASLAYASLDSGKKYFIRIIGWVKARSTGSYEGGIVTGSYEVSPVPLPGAALLFGSSLFGLIAAGRRRRSATP